MKESVKERIIKVLLIEKNLSKYKVSKLASASFGWTHEFLKNLEKLKLIKDTKVSNIEGLFSYWIKSHKKPKHREYMIQNPLEILKGINLDYAVTTYYAENVLQRFLFPSRLDVYIKEEDLEKWHKMLTSKGLYGKGNVRILIDSSGLFKSQKIQELTIVNLPQLILDLKLEGGPCEEAAEILLQKLKKDVS
ncbi:MAG TPA: hypothetical protein VJA18_01955 [Candidatus Nanoarchaeia archaeon]|nr:hypothetical protein [Candidatus Nanoarchaeia archaeon]